METKLREVKIEEYWPLIVKNTAEFGQIAVAENPEFNNLAECIYRVLCDSFIDADMTEYGVSRWEKMLGITPAEGSSLDDRKAAILTQLSVKIPYTWRVLKQMLIPIIGSEDKFEMSLNNEMGELYIKFKIPASETPMEAVKQLMERVLPMNLVTVYDYDIETLMPILNDGLSEMLGEGQFVLEYIADEKKVVAHTDRVDELTVTAVEELLARVLPQNIEVERYNHHIEVSWRDINKYAHITTLNELSNFTTKEAFQSDLTSDGWWIYPLTSLTSQIHGYAGGAHTWFSNNPKLKGVDFYLPKGTTGYLVFATNTNLEEAHLYIGGSGAGGSLMFSGNSKLKKVTGYINGCVFNDMCSGCKNLSDFDLEMSPVKVGDGYLFDGMFSSCVLNKESALRFLSRIPNSTDAWRGFNTKITLGIHVDHKTDEEVLAAISAAEEAGWTLTVQWNGTPTSTASTMAMGQLIYAKVSETERPDGTTEQYLDWGHYVTNSEEYETFRSLESAYRYFNLEMPENE